MGFTIGSRQQSTDQQGERTTASASTVGSIEGDIDIEAQRVNIMEARETSKASTETKTKQSGVTIGVTNPVLSAVQTGEQM